MTTKSGAGKFILAGTAVMCAVGATSAKAGTLEIKYLNSIYGATAQATVAAGPGAGNYPLTQPGLLVWEQTGMPQNSNYPSPFATYCSEISQYADFNSFVYTENTDVAGKLGSGDATALAKLWQKFDAGTLTGVDASAFQLVVYNIIYDTDLTLTGGNFTATSGNASLITTADAMMAWLLSSEAANYATATLTLLENPSKQDQLYGVSNTGGIPEPATIGIGILGSAALLMRRKK